MCSIHGNFHILALQLSQVLKSESKPRGGGGGRTRISMVFRERGLSPEPRAHREAARASHVGLKGEGSGHKRKAVLSPPTEPEGQSRSPTAGGCGDFTWGICRLPRFAGTVSRGTGIFQTPIPSPFVEGTSTPCQALGACHSISFPQPSQFAKPAGVTRGKCPRAS